MYLKFQFQQASGKEVVCQELCCEQVWPQSDPEIKEIKMTISEKFSFEILEIQSRFLV